MNHLSRRRLLGASAALMPTALTAGAWAAGAQTGLTATITLNGQTFVFAEDSGVDLGDYHDPAGRFVMSCRRVQVRGCPLRVDYRRIRERNWYSVVFGCGDIATDPINVGAYDVTLNDGTRAPQTMRVPIHPGYSRWRWNSGRWPFPVTRIADLTAAKLLPRFNPALTRKTDRYNGPYHYTPMGLAGLSAYMPTTGARGDIGQVTDAQGWYLCHEDDPRALDDVLAQGEAAGTYTWDFLDPATNAVIDPIIQHPQATLYGPQAGSPYIRYPPQSSTVDVTLTGPPGTVLSPKGDPPAWNFVVVNRVQCRIPVDSKIPPGGSVVVRTEILGPTIQPGPATLATPVVGVTVALTPNSFKPGSGITIDSAHQPALSYLPFLLTGDPYFLENLQRQVAFIVIENPSAPVRGYGVLQPRATGWSARTLAQAAKVSPDHPPSWLLPKATFRRGIEQWADFFVPRTVRSTTPERAVLHLVSTAWDGGSDGTHTWYQPWQEDICLGGIAWLALLHPDTKWVDVVHWFARQTMARLDSASGWSASMPTGYLWKTGVDDAHPYAASWRDMWEANLRFFPAGTHWSADFPIPTAGEYDYLGHMAAGMALAWQAGVTEIAPALTKLETTLLKGLEQGGGRYRPGKYAIGGPVA